MEVRVPAHAVNAKAAFAPCAARKLLFPVCTLAYCFLGNCDAFGAAWAQWYGVRCGLWWKR